MPFERSAGGIIYREQEGKINYLLLHYPSGIRTDKDYWDFPKGHVEKGEKVIDTAKREIEEETGLKDIKFLSGFKEWIKYFFRVKGKTVFKIVTFFLAETKDETITISSEHMGYVWLPYEEALKKLSFKNAKKILEKADSFLANKER